MTQEGFPTPNTPPHHVNPLIKHVGHEVQRPTGDLDDHGNPVTANETITVSVPMSPGEAAEGARDRLEARRKHSRPIELGGFSHPDSELLDIMASLHGAEGAERARLEDRRDLLVRALDGDLESKIEVAKEHAGSEGGYGTGREKTGLTARKIEANLRKKDRIEQERIARGYPPKEKDPRGTKILTMFEGLTPEELKAIKMLQQNVGIGRGPWHGNVVEARLSRLDRQVPAEWFMSKDGTMKPKVKKDGTLVTESMGEFIRRQVHPDHRIITSESAREAKLAYNPFPRIAPEANYALNGAARGIRRVARRLRR